MKIPVSWLREYVEVDATTREICERLAISTFEFERISYRGVPDVDGNLGLYRVGLVLEAGKHPNADRLQLCTVDVGEGEPRQIVCGAWNFGAGAHVAVALPGAVMPGGQKLEQAKLRGVVSNGMILSERELEIGPDHSGIIVLGQADRPRHASGRRPAARRGGDRGGDELQPPRPALDLRDRPRGRGRLQRRAEADARPRAGPPGRPGAGGGARRRPGGLPALHRPALPRRADRPLARVDEGAAVGRRPAADLERGRHHQLRDARARQPAARVRPPQARPGPDHRPAGGAGGGGSHARRRAARARPVRSRDRRRRARGRARRDHGRRGDRALRRHLGHPARGRELRAGRDHAHLGAARAAHRGLEPLGEGRRPVRRRAGRDLRDRAARRADGGALCRRDRRAGRPPGVAGHAAAAGADRRGRRARDPARRAAPDPGAARLRGRGARRGRHRPDLARPRRHARDRRGRGGHPGPRAREGAVHAAAAARDVRAADRGTAPAPR